MPSIQQGREQRGVLLIDGGYARSTCAALRCHLYVVVCIVSLSLSLCFVSFRFVLGMVVVERERDVFPIWILFHGLSSFSLLSPLLLVVIQKLEGVD